MGLKLTKAEKYGLLAFVVIVALAVVGRYLQQQENSEGRRSSQTGVRDPFGANSEGSRSSDPFGAYWEPPDFKRVGPNATRVVPNATGVVRSILRP